MINASTNGTAAADITGIYNWVRAQFNAGRIYITVFYDIEDDAHRFNTRDTAEARDAFMNYLQGTRLPIEDYITLDENGLWDAAMRLSYYQARDRENRALEAETMDRMLDAA